MSEWKWLPNYEGHYSVTPEGMVWSCEREVESTTNKGKPYIKYLKGKWLKPGINGCGYKHIILCKNGELKTANIHRLVATAFIPNPLNLPEINHKDGNKLNNYFLNLEWVTYQQNVNHAVETRLCSPNRSSEYYGVSWNKRAKKWKVGIRIKGKKYHIGYFSNEIDAAQAWDNYLNEHNITDRLFNFPKL